MGEGIKSIILYDSRANVSATTPAGNRSHCLSGPQFFEYTTDDLFTYIPRFDKFFLAQFTARAATDAALSYPDVAVQDRQPARAEFYFWKIVLLNECRLTWISEYRRLSPIRLPRDALFLEPPYMAICFSSCDASGPSFLAARICLLPRHFVPLLP